MWAEKCTPEDSQEKISMELIYYLTLFFTSATWTHVDTSQISSSDILCGNVTNNFVQKKCFSTHKYMDTCLSPENFLPERLAYKSGEL